MSTESEFRIPSFKSTTLFPKHNQEVEGLCTAMWPSQSCSCCPEMHRGKGAREAQTQSRWICNAPAQRINVVHTWHGICGKKEGPPDCILIHLSIHPSIQRYDNDTICGKTERNNRVHGIYPSISRLQEDWSTDC